MSHHIFKHQLLLMTATFILTNCVTLVHIYWFSYQAKVSPYFVIFLSELDTY